nr:MAG TPA: putative terminase small subunit [Siphoviridae sp. ct8TV20]
MARYNTDIVERICSLIREDSYTIAEICHYVNISKETYYQWLKTKTDFSDAIKKAEDDFNSMIIVEAKRSLIKLIKGQVIQEKKNCNSRHGKER